MYAIIPDQCTKLVGVGKWLNVHAEYTSVSCTSVVKTIPSLKLIQGDTRVSCAPQELATVSTSKLSRLFPFLSPRNKTAKRKSERFTRFFRSFSYIEKLVNRHLNSRDAMDHTQNSLFICQPYIECCEKERHLSYLFDFLLPPPPLLSSPSPLFARRCVIVRYFLRFRKDLFHCEKNDNLKQKMNLRHEIL